jgi:hypothetical protein
MGVVSMGLFRNRKRSLLSPDFGNHLASWGFHSFHGTADQIDFGTVQAMSRLQIDPDMQAHSSQAIAELHAAAGATGGWAIYAASEVVDAFLPAESDSAEAHEMLDERLIFLRNQRIPNLAYHLSIKDRARYDQLFPGELPSRS